MFKLLNLEYANLKLAIRDKHFIIGEKKIEYIISDENTQLIKLPIVIDETLCIIIVIKIDIKNEKI